MKQIVQVATGKPSESVRLIEVAESLPKDNEIVVRVQVSPINPADLLRLTGQHAYKSTFPFVPGIEGVGIVEQVGANVSNLKPGTVVLLPYGGVWTEKYVCVASRAIALPSEIDMLQASMLGVNPITAAGLLSNFGNLKPGDWVLQNSANSAVGKLVVRLAAKRGFKTINIVRRESVVEELLAIGADVVLVGEENLASRVQEATHNAEIHLALDAIAGASSGRLVECLTESSTLVVYGLLSGEPVQLPAAAMVFFDLTVTGFSRLRVLHAMGSDKVQATYNELAEMVMNKEIQTDIEATYPLERITEALDRASSEGRNGKILLKLEA